MERFSWIFLHRRRSSSRFFVRAEISGLTKCIRQLPFYKVIFFSLNSPDHKESLSSFSLKHKNNNLQDCRRSALTGLKYYITHTISGQKSNNSTVNIDRVQHLNSTFFNLPSPQLTLSLSRKKSKESITSHEMPVH